MPDIELNTWRTNLGLADDEIIRLYHAHGECEQYHSEIKSDMDVERLPSRKFATNEWVLELTILAYNILRIIGQESLRSNGYLPEILPCLKPAHQIYFQNQAGLAGEAFLDTANLSNFTDSVQS